MAKEKGKSAGVKPAALNGPANPQRGDFVYRSILDAIKTGKWAPGSRIREEEIAASLGVSRTPVREAILLLQSRRLVEVVAGRGLSVAELSMQQVIELYFMRETLAGAAGRSAAQHASDEEIAMMKHYIAEMKANHGNVPKLTALNSALHKTIYDAAHNRYLLEALTNIDDTFTLLGRSTFSLPERHAKADAEHMAIVMAIDARDSEAAETASRAHIREAHRARLRMMRGA